MTTIKGGTRRYHIGNRWVWAESMEEAIRKARDHPVIAPDAMQTTTAHSQVPDKRSEHGQAAHDLAQKVLAVLGTGKENAKTTDQIARELGLKQTRTNFSIRTAAKVLRQQRIPAVTGHDGIWLAATQDEIDAYTKGLVGRHDELGHDIKDAQGLEPMRQTRETLFD